MYVANHRLIPLLALYINVDTNMRIMSVKSSLLDQRICELVFAIIRVERDFFAFVEFRSAKGLPPAINEEELFSLLASWELAIIFSYLHSECLFQVSLSRIEVNVVSPKFFCKVR